MENANSEWRKCSTCKKPIGFSTKYYVCSVSTCNGQRTGYVFCTVLCWDSHVPGAKHRDAAALEEMSPRRGAPAAGGSSAVSGGASLSGTNGNNPGAGMAPIRRIVSSGAPSNASSQGAGGGARPNSSAPREILIVASKLKDYIRIRSEMNTSGDVMEILSEMVRRHCDDAIDRARADGRKTVMERDFRKLPSL